MEVKANKELIWEAIKEIERHTLNPTNNFLILEETIWKDLPAEDRFRIRRLLLTNGLIHLYNNSQWAFQLTAAGIVLKKDDLQSNGTLTTKKSYKQFWLGVLTTAIGTVLGTSASYIQDRVKEDFQIKHPTTTVVRPVIQVIHDTISLKRNNP